VEDHQGRPTRPSGVQIDDVAMLVGELEIREPVSQSRSDRAEIQDGHGRFQHVLAFQNRRFKKANHRNLCKDSARLA
jgi:hypothetical protein